MSLLTCRDLAVGYEGRSVVEHIGFSVDAGDYLCIVGENGSGKSTMMKTLLGLQPALNGTIEYEAGFDRKRVGYLSQQTDVQKDFPASVREIVLSGCLGKHGWSPFWSKEEKDLADRNMERMGVKKLADACYRNLSGGQQQRVLLARTLCTQGRLFFLDEPITGLDQETTQEFYTIINDLVKKEKIAVVMVTHDIRAARKYASHILDLSRNAVFLPKDTYFEKRDGGAL